MEWWNRLAVRNGKVKFRNQREAAEFVRSIAKSSGGPNPKVLEMRRQYEAVQEARARQPNTGSEPHNAVSH